jgi:hypothetical protein
VFGDCASIFLETHPMRSPYPGKYIFCEENGNKVYYSLVDTNGETLIAGNIPTSGSTFREYMEERGFEYLKVSDSI